MKSPSRKLAGVNLQEKESRWRGFSPSNLIMPTPSPAPTAEEIVIVSEITMLSVDTVSEMVASDSSQNISDAKWSLTLADIAIWNAGLGTKSGKLKKVGSIEFFEGKDADYRLLFRNNIRRRYGYDDLVSETNGVMGILQTTLDYF